MTELLLVVIDFFGVQGHLLVPITQTCINNIYQDSIYKFKKSENHINNEESKLSEKIVKLSRIRIKEIK